MQNNEIPKKGNFRKVVPLLLLILAVLIVIIPYFSIGNAGWATCFYTLPIGAVILSIAIRIERNNAKIDSNK